MVESVVASVVSVDALRSRKATDKVAHARVSQEKQVTERIGATDQTDRGERPIGTILSADKSGSQTDSPATGTAQSAAFDAVNKALGPSGQRIESLGSDALQRWINEKAIEERDGGYSRITLLPTGQVTLVQVQHPKKVREPKCLVAR